MDVVHQSLEIIMLFIETTLDDEKILINLDSIGYLQPHKKEENKTIAYFRGAVGNISVATLNESYDSLLKKIHDPCR